MVKKVKQKKIVWVVSDGIPGHFNQSKGVLFALEILFDLDVYWIDLKLRNSYLRRLLAFILNLNIPKLSKIKYFYRLSLLPNNQPDIVIGAGGNVSYAVAWLARAKCAKNIFCGSLRHLKKDLFDVVLVLEPNMLPPFISLTVSAMPLSQRILSLASKNWVKEHSDIQCVVWTMLVGGDGAGAKYTISDWENLAKQMNLLAEQNNISWFVSTSRRTGVEAERALKGILKPEYIIDTVWWSEQPRQVLHAFLGLSERVYCGADSMSMMMESLAAQRKLVVYHPECFKPDTKFQGVLTHLQKKSFIQLISISEVDRASGVLEKLKVLDYEPSEKLAELLNERLFS